MKVFITGSNGFVGSVVTAALLSQKHKVFALCRGDVKRVHDSLQTVRPQGDWRAGELHVMHGDVAVSGLGLDRDSRRVMEVDLVVHAAGHTKFDADDPLHEEVNVRGARNVAELSAELRWPRFIHVSTAYVCGHKTGRIEEKGFPDSTQAHNPYEESKSRAEYEVSRILKNQATMFRPSIVVGALGNDWAGSLPTTYTGYYGYFHGFWRLKRKLSPVDTWDMGETRIPGDSGAEINLIPADALAGMIMSLVDHPESDGGIYHGVSPTGPHYSDLVALTLKHIGVRGGKIGYRLDPPVTALERLISAGIGPFLPYVGENRTFSTSNMGRFYDMAQVPAIGEEEIRRLIVPAIECGFGTKTVQVTRS
ncbi:SDR family oxidoreductase [Candidatus Uhrbacteria bacterium]|nr:SDR family oxidoreductase [Candidatus Uhrbacteria bacterium]